MGRLAMADREGKAVIQSLRPDYRAMARLVAIGAANQELIEQFNLSAPQVSLIVNSPLFRAEVARLQEGLELSLKDGALELQEMQHRALEVVAQDLYSERPSAGRIRTAFEVLNRTGLHPKSDAVNDNRQTTINYIIPRPGDDPIIAAKVIEALSVETIQDDNDSC